jgi:sulfide:quinone oxidoreductase
LFGFSKLDVMFGRRPASGVRHSDRDIAKPGVHVVQACVREMDPVARLAVTDAGVFGADIIVPALGPDLHPDATPGLVDGGHEFYTRPALSRRARCWSASTAAASSRRSHRPRSSARPRPARPRY